MNEYGFSSALMASQTNTASLYGAQRPTFSEDGKGMPYTSLLNAAGDSVVNQDISYDTSSKDPLMVRARVFIGNIIRGPITRDDLIELFKPFGKLLALTFFKGYAFVQFAEGFEADAACTGLNGKRWKGAILDVHLAMTGPSMKKNYNSNDSSEYSRKRRYDDYSRDEVNVLDETAEQNKRNRDVAMRDPTTNDDLADSAMADTLICGGCRFVTCDFESYKDHRVAGCKHMKTQEEPKTIRCASCSQRFLSAWALMCHLTDFHRMMLYKVEDATSARDLSMASNGTDVSSTGAPTPAKHSRAPTPPSAQQSGDASGQPPVEDALNNTDVANVSEGSTVASSVPIGTTSSAPPVQPAATAPETSIASLISSGAQWTPLMGQTIPGISGLAAPNSYTNVYGQR